jgi:hypothetical protein
VQTIVIVYLILTIVFFIDIVLSIIVLEFVKQSTNVRERPKLVVKIDELRSMKKYTIAWPYVLYKLLRNNAN